LRVGRLRGTPGEGAYLVTSTPTDNFLQNSGSIPTILVKKRDTGVVGAADVYTSLGPLGNDWWFLFGEDMNITAYLPRKYQTHTI
jgi:hypothetical protein